MLRKMVRLAKQHNVTSIADFLASRYGKSRAVGVTATLFATVGVLPYIALQLQAVSSTFKTIAEPAPWLDGSRGVVHTDTSLIVAALMALFTILFGVRNVQASEQHRGMMLAIAFESVVKLLALLTVGPFVLFVLFDGPADLLAHVARAPAVAERVDARGLAAHLGRHHAPVGDGLPLPAAPVPCRGGRAWPSRRASRTARWLFPTYLLLINLFVVPIAAAGLLLLGPQVNPDLFVLQLPLANGESWLSAFVFIGGLSAATSMVIVACMALSGMIGNELVMPYLLRRQARWGAGVPRDMGPLVVFVRRAAVVLILMAGYAYERIISGYLPLASIGLISFCAVANFAPGVVLGLYWRRAHRHGVVAGLAGGFVVWLYALLLPTLRQSRGRRPGGAAAALPAGAAGRARSGRPGLRRRHPGQRAPAGRRLAAGPRRRLRRRAGRRLRARRGFSGGGRSSRSARRRPTPRASTSCASSWRASSARSARCGPCPASGSRSKSRSPAPSACCRARLGAASARIIVAAFGRRGRLLPRSARALIDEASEAIRYNYEILRNTLDHVGMGIAAFDRDGRLEIFNDRFTDPAVARRRRRWRSAPRRLQFGAAPDVVALLRRPETPQTHEIATRERQGHRAQARPAARRRLRRHLQRRDGARAHRRGAARERPPASPVDRDAGAAGDRAHRRAGGEPRRGRGRQPRQDALHRRRQPRPAAAAARRAPVHGGDDRPRSRQRSRRQDRHQPGRGRIAARRPARHLQARRRRLQAGEAAVRPAADVRFAGHRLRAGRGAPRRRARGGADAGLRVDRSGLPAPHPAEPAVQCAALRPGRGADGARSAGLPPCRQRAAHRGEGQRTGHRRRQAGRSSSTNSCACRPRTTRRARSGGWAWAWPSSTASRACSTCRSASPRRRAAVRPSR